MQRLGLAPRLGVVLLALAVVGVAATGQAAAAGRAAAGSCNITQTHSIAGVVKTNVEFVNKTAGTVKVYWLDYSGKRVYYYTLPPGASYTQRTFATNPWVILDSAGACIGYVIAPHAQYVISGAASASAAPAKPASPGAAHTAAMPHWVYQMINDFNLGISQPSGILAESLLIYKECVAVPPDFAFVDGNSASMSKAVQSQFVPYNKLIPSWIGQIGGLKASSVTSQARAKLQAALKLHLQEVNHWVSAESAIKRHDCASFLGDLKAAAQVGAPDWADQYVAVKALAGLYGQGGSASHQTPYAQKVG